MNTKEIVKIWKLQSTPLNVAGENGDYDAWWKAAKTKIGRKEIIQVLKEYKHMDDMIDGDLDSWFALNSWSDLVAMMNCCLELKTDSFLDTLR